MSIVTDAALVALPIMVIYPLNMGLGERLIVMLFYCTRALLVYIANTLVGSLC